MRITENLKKGVRTEDTRTEADQIVREMNREMKAQGCLTVAGKCPAQYFKQKFYGFQIPRGERNDGK